MTIGSRRVGLLRAGLTALGVAAAIAAAPTQAADPGSAADLLDALVTGAARGVEQGQLEVLPALASYLDLPPPWRAQVRASIEATDLPAQVRQRAATGSADAGRWGALAAQIDALRGLGAFAKANSVELGRGAARAVLPAAVDGVQWLRIDGASGSRTALEFAECRPNVTGFVLAGDQPGRSVPAVSYDDRGVVLGGTSELAVRIDASNCSGNAPRDIAVSRLPAEQAVPANGTVGVGAYSVTLQAKTPIDLRLPTRSGRLYEVLLAPVGAAPDPGVAVFREGADEPFVSDDDGGFELGSHATGIVGDGRPVKVQLVAVEDRGGPASLWIRETEAKRQAVGETRTYRTDNGSLNLLQVALRAGAYEFRTLQLSEGVDTVVAVFAPGNDKPVAENDDGPDMGLASLTCIVATKAGDHLVRIGTVDQTSGTFVFVVTSTESCASPESAVEAAAEAAADAADAAAGAE